MRDRKEQILEEATELLPKRSFNSFSYKNLPVRTKTVMIAAFIVAAASSAYGVDVLTDFEFKEKHPMKQEPETS